MKTIQIPTNSNPFTVNINNQVYQYRAGETVEVPDEVAAAIEDALELEPKPERYLSKFAQHVGGSLSELTAKDLEEVSKIFTCAFYGNYLLAKVTIPRNITTIEGSAFEFCANLRHVYLPEIPPTLEKTNAFANIRSSCVFYCKTQESLDAYKAADKWSTLAGTYSFVVEE